jgi:hypothetical protein
MQITINMGKLTTAQKESENTQEFNIPSSGITAKSGQQRTEKDHKPYQESSTLALNELW